MFGIPPASETTSGRDATANRARISEAVMPGGAGGVAVDVAVEAGAAEVATGCSPVGPRGRWTRGVLHDASSMDDQPRARHHRTGAVGHGSRRGRRPTREMSRKVVAAHPRPPRRLPEAAPCRTCAVLAARPGPPRPRRRATPADEKRRLGLARCCATGAPAAGWRWSTTCRSGSLLYAPDGVRARRRRRSRPRRSQPDAVLLTTVYVAPDARRRRARPDAGAGHGPRPDRARRDQGGRGVRRHPRPAGAAGCVVPADFLGSVGFKTQRGRTRATPRMRMELRVGAHLAGRGRGGAGAAAGRGPAPRPKPTRRARRRRRRGPRACTSGPGLIGRCGVRR